MFKFAGKRPRNLGVHGGKLAPCANKPNNVSSQAAASDTLHHIAPLVCGSDVQAGLHRLKKILEQTPRVKIVESSADYLYAEFSTPLMGYVDDVEFYNDGQVIQVRSASRLGYSDLGVNRKRIESLRKILSI